MQWLNEVVDSIVAKYPDGEILIESGSSPSGTYHFGHIRELVTCDAVLLELKRRGRVARHIAYVDDLDALRKIPVNIPGSYEKYLGQSLCDIPAPDGSSKTYAVFFTQGLIDFSKALGIDVEFRFAHKDYRSGFYVDAIERALESLAEVKKILEEVSGRQLGDEWSPIQINEGGYLKKRQFVSLDKATKALKYLDKDGQVNQTKYNSGEVKLDWRIDWPARWWLLGVKVEPFGRDHATKGGSYDTGSALMDTVFKAPAPISIPYDFVNLAGDSKKMSASKGTGIDAVDVVEVLPPEVVRFFMLRYAPIKRLYFDPLNVAELIDEFAKSMSEEPDSQLMEICHRGLEPTISRVPFTHLVASYQSALKDASKTIEIIERTEHGHHISQDRGVIERELKYIDRWLSKWAPEEIKFDLLSKAEPSDFSEDEIKFMQSLAKKIEELPDNADGEAFHKLIYEMKDESGLEPKAIFTTLYKALIGKNSGPRAGWFLSILPREWLVKRLLLEA